MAIRFHWQELARLRMDIVHPERQARRGCNLRRPPTHRAQEQASLSALNEVEKADSDWVKTCVSERRHRLWNLRPYLNKVWVSEFDGLCSVAFQYH